MIRPRKDLSMARLILNSPGIPTSASLRIDAEPRSVDSHLDAGRKAVDIAPVAATETPETTRRVRRGWLWFNFGPKVDVPRANLTCVEEMMLNLP
jgi:hypothetical protein